MLTSVATGLVALCVVLACWVTVQQAWRRVFVDADGDPDALAGRMGCHAQPLCESDTCTRPCAKRAGATKEDDR